MCETRRVARVHQRRLTISVVLYLVKAAERAEFDPRLTLVSGPVGWTLAVVASAVDELLTLPAIFTPVIVTLTDDTFTVSSCRHTVHSVTVIGHTCKPNKNGLNRSTWHSGPTRMGRRNHVFYEDCTLALPGEYAGMICAATAMRVVATITVATCLHAHRWIKSSK